MKEKHHGHHPFHGPRRGRPFQRGDFKFILLQHLKDKPSYGYEVIRSLEERFHGFYSPSAGSVYPTFQLLEEMGFVSSAEKEGKKVYSITPEGSAFLDDQKESAERINTQIKNWWNPENMDDVSETLGELRRLSRLLRDKARTAESGELDRMKKVLTRACDEISEE
ncbi:PadR family transcriptional regulator [Chloroflexota bacterium]